MCVMVLHAIPSKSLEKIAPLSAPFKQTLIISDSELTILSCTGLVTEGPTKVEG